jgi:hypothetical protein
VCAIFCILCMLYICNHVATNLYKIMRRVTNLAGEGGAQGDTLLQSRQPEVGVAHHEQRLQCGQPTQQLGAAASGGLFAAAAAAPNPTTFSHRHSITYSKTQNLSLTCSKNHCSSACSTHCVEMCTSGTSAAPSPNNLHRNLISKLCSRSCLQYSNRVFQSCYCFNDGKI